MVLAQGRQARLGKGETALPFFLIVLATPAQGQVYCDRRDIITARLESRYEEFQAAAGLATTGALVELWATQDGATWTLLVTTVNGITCVIAAGFHWQAMPDHERNAL